MILTEILVNMYMARDSADRYSWILSPPNRFFRYSGIVTTCRNREKMEEEPGNVRDIISYYSTSLSISIER